MESKINNEFKFYALFREFEIMKVKFFYSNEKIMIYIIFILTDN